MTVEETRALLAAHYRRISGITKVFDALPKKIERTELPCVLIRVASADFAQATQDGYEVSDQHYVERRQYRAQLFVRDLAEGTEGQTEEEMIPFLDSVSVYFMDRPGLQIDTSPTDAVYSHSFQRDTGANSSAQYPKDTGTNYGAIEFTHQIEQIKLKTFRD